MNNALRTESINRTVTVVIRHALDIEHAVDVLMEEFGFDHVFCALATIADDARAHRAMWVALCTQTFGTDTTTA